MGLEIFPPVAGQSDDAAAYIVDLAFFDRPRLYIVGGPEFVWPLGTEDISLMGGPTLAEHRYLGATYVDVQVTHRDALRIQMSGEFPGRTGADNAVALRSLLIADDPPDYKRLSLPGILTNDRKVISGEYNFNRSKEDLTGTFLYQVDFLVTDISDAQSQATSYSSSSAATSATATRIFIVRDGARTLRAVAGVVYRDTSKWRQVYDLNAWSILAALPGVQMTNIPTSLLPVGLKLKY